MYYIILIIYYILGISFFMYYSISQKYKKTTILHNYLNNNIEDSQFVIDNSLTENLI